MIGTMELVSGGGVGGGSYNISLQLKGRCSKKYMCTFSLNVPK